MHGEKKKEDRLVVLLGLLSAPLLSIWHAFVLVKLWIWFVVPLGAHPIGKAHAYGLSCIVTLMTVRSRRSSDDPTIAEAVAFSVASAAVALLVGWIAHEWM